MPRDGTEAPRPERPEPRQVTPDQVRLEYANQQITLAHVRERDMAVEIVARDAALAELRQAGEQKDARIAELETQLSAMCADLAGKEARIAELEAASVIVEPAEALE